MNDINDLTVDDLQYYLRKYRFNEDCLNYFKGTFVKVFFLK